MTDFAEFHRLMSEVHRKRRLAVEAENASLWAIVIELVRAIEESELDGSGISDLTLLGQEKAEQLRAILIAAGASSEGGVKQRWEMNGRTGLYEAGAP